MLVVTDLAKSYGQGETSIPVLGKISFAVAQKEIVTIVGPSGAGKTTLLRCLAGLMPPSSGTVAIDGRVLSGPPREIAVVFQDYSRSLLPWLSVKNNVGFPLRGKVKSSERETRVAEAVEAVGLRAAQDRLPWQLSGGMQQRVAIARALAYRPRVLLMDEPFASVDAQTRIDLEDLLLKVQCRFGMTVLFITHDIDESVYLANRVVVLGGKPATVREIVKVDLPFPRDQIVTKELQEFGHLRAHVLRLIRHKEELVVPAGDH